MIQGIDYSKGNIFYKNGINKDWSKMEVSICTCFYTFNLREQLLEKITKEGKINMRRNG